MVRKVKAELTSPVHDVDGTVLLQPGTRFDEGDKAVGEFPPDHIRYVIVDEPDPEPKPAKATTSKAEK